MNERFFRLDSRLCFHIFRLTFYGMDVEAGVNRYCHIALCWMDDYPDTIAHRNLGSYITERCASN